VQSRAALRPLFVVHALRHPRHKAGGIFHNFILHGVEVKLAKK
jgi:hypothetical protein